MDEGAAGEVIRQATLTHGGRCSLVELLRTRHREEPHPLLGTSTETRWKLPRVDALLLGQDADEQHLLKVLTASHLYNKKRLTRLTIEPHLGS